jgi:biofilm PGA synthesis N-glycosyltransferase PgaC
MRIAIVVPLRDEETHLPVLLNAIAAQSRPPDKLLLVDDGSHDRSLTIAQRFADAHAYARVLSRPARPQADDRLAAAAELRAFQWGVEHLDPHWDVLAKLDADLQLGRDTLAEVEAVLRSDPGLGITGPYLSIPAADGTTRRERCPSYHVRGATKFYRRACWEQIAPLSPILGWDTIDEVAARMHGWRTASFESPSGDPLHLRPTGAVDGRLRAYRRWGACAYAIGDHPLWLAVSAARRTRDRPWLVAAGAYLAGWKKAARRGAPRAEPEIRAHVRREQLARLRAALGVRRSRGAATTALGERQPLA